jgi:hypothetical protein
MTVTPTVSRLSTSLRLAEPAGTAAREIGV